MDPNNRVLGPKCHDIYVIGALKPCYLGPWTLRARDVGQQNGNNYSIIGSMLRFNTDSGKENGNYHLGCVLPPPSNSLYQGSY